MGLFRWTSRQRRLASPDTFQGWAVSVLREEAPELAARPGEPETIVLASGAILGLQNLLAIARQGASDEELRAQLLKVARAASQEPAAPRAWEEARRLLRPQLMPTEYVERSDGSLLQRPFHSGLVAGLVIDLPECYGYVRTRDLEAWGQPEAELWRVALENLDRASVDLAIQAVLEPPDRWMVIQKRDGYDAVRILSPGMRALIAEKLGEPFYAGTPNRDFLVVWAADNTDRWWDFVGPKLEKDFGEQPYPFTPAISVATRTTVRLGERPRR